MYKQLNGSRTTSIRYRTKCWGHTLKRVMSLTTC